MIPIPFPDESDTPVHEAAKVSLEPGQKAIVTMSPETAGSQHRIPVVAISKHGRTNYRIKVDGSTRFGPSPIPPTDPDDMGTVFMPTLSLQREMKVQIKDVRSSGGARTFYVQTIGWDS